MTHDFNRDLIRAIPTMERFARNLTRNPAEADDLVQDCMERALRYRDKFEKGTNLEAWLCTILKNIHLTRWTRARRFGEVEMMEDEVVSAPSQDHRVLLQEVAAAIDGLSAEHQRLIHFVAVNGESYHDAALSFGVSVGTIRSRLSRVRNRLRSGCEVPHRHGIPRRGTPQSVERAVRPLSVPSPCSSPSPSPCPSPAPDPAVPSGSGTQSPRRVLPDVSCGKQTEGTTAMSNSSTPKLSMRRLVAGLLLATALTAPPAFAQQTPPGNAAASSQSQARNNAVQGSPATGQQAGQAAKAPKRIHLSSADAIAGQPVRNPDGEEVGEVEYLLIDPQSGSVRYALIGSGGLFDIGEDITPVPWSSLTMSPGREATDIMLNADLDTLRQGQRFSRQDLQRLTEPTLMTQVVGLFAPQGNRQGSGATNPQQAQSGSGSSGSAGSQPQASQAGQSASGQSAQAPGGSDRPMVLVGQELITTLIPRALASPDTLRGSTVQSSSGEDIGDIDRLMIDIDRGRVPYVLVGRGGFLGFGEDWLPVPLQALTWSPSDEGYILNADQSKLQQMPTLRKEALPAQIRTTDLQKLYDRFGVRPYWTRQG